MIKFFRKIRQNLLSEGKTGKYLKYAIEEIILVVIGILFALQINNWNELNKQRVKEVQFLENLKSDLIFEENELDRFIGIIESMVNSAQIALEHFNGKPVENIQMFNFHAINVGVWQAFQRNNNTFLELLNSGNLTIISNDSIKKGLINLDLIHKKIISNQEHLRNDMEHYSYGRWFKIVDLDPFAQSFVFYDTKRKFDNEIDKLISDSVLKNGFVVSIFTNSLLIDDYKRMKDLNIKIV